MPLNQVFYKERGSMHDTFEQLGLSESILKALADLGFEAPTPVQSQTIPEILAGKDVIVQSKTGSGKTAAFGVPLLQRIQENTKYPQALILTPTRELAIQVDSDLKHLSKYMPLKAAVVYGQHAIQTEINALEKGVSVITGTPGRVLDHIKQGNLKTKEIHYLVLDEADRMLDMGFIEQVGNIIKHLPKDRITLLFSATMPAEIQRLCQKYMKDPIGIEVESETLTVDTIYQAHFRVNHHDKMTLLEHLLWVEKPESCMIFCNTRIAVDKVCAYLSRRGFPVESLHGAITQAKRTKTIHQFKKSGFRILVATDVAARGLHVDDLSLVINYDVPNELDNYVHRIGRTGRAGNGGRALTFVTGEDLMTLYEIEERISVMIEEIDPPSDDVVRESRQQNAPHFVSHLTEAEKAERQVKDKPARQGDRKGPSSKPRSEDAPKRKAPEKKPMAASASAKPQREQQQGAPKVQRPVAVQQREAGADPAVQPKPVVKQQVPVAKQKVTAQVTQKPASKQIPQKVRALSDDEVKATVAAYQARKKGEVPAEKPGLLKKIFGGLFK